MRKLAMPTLTLQPLKIYTTKPMRIFYLIAKIIFIITIDCIIASYLTTEFFWWAFFILLALEAIAWIIYEFMHPYEDNDYDEKLELWKFMKKKKEEDKKFWQNPLDNDEGEILYNINKEKIVESQN